MSAVEAYRVVVGLVIVNRTPLDGVAGDEAVRLRTVVLVEGEDMVQADGHHVIDTGLAGSQHHAEK